MNAQHVELCRRIEQFQLDSSEADAAVAVVAVAAAPAGDRLAPVSGPVPGAVVAAFAIVVAAFPAITAAESLSQVVREG